MVTKTLRDLLRQKRQYDQEYNSQDEMPPRTARCYRNLLREIKKAAERSQKTLPGICRTVPAQQGQGVLL